jgi:carboxypeptidase Taq
VGAFTSYTIGDLVAAQLMASARRAILDLDDYIAAGDLGPLVAWLRANVHWEGARHSPDELIKRATGEELSTAPWISYVRAKAHDLELLQAR